MSTAMHWYNMAAQKFGNVEPTDEQAVEDFFVKTMTKLDKKAREDVIRYLLGRDGPTKIPDNCTCSSCVKMRELKSKYG